MGFGTCCICTLSFDLATMAMLNKCGHTYHKDCITPWVTSKKSCPKCRVKSTPSDVRQLFIDENLDESTNEGGGPSSEVFAHMEKQLDTEVQANQKLTVERNAINQQKEIMAQQLLQAEEKVKLLPKKDDRIQALEKMLGDQNKMEKALQTSQARLKASELYTMLAKKKDFSESDLDEFVGPNSDPASKVVIGILQRDLKKAEEQYRTENSLLKEDNKRRKSEARKYKKLADEEKLENNRLKRQLSQNPSHRVDSPQRTTFNFYITTPVQSPSAVKIEQHDDDAFSDEDSLEVIGVFMPPGETAPKPRILSSSANEIEFLGIVERGQSTAQDMPIPTGASQGSKTQEPRAKRVRTE